MGRKNFTKKQTREIKEKIIDFLEEGKTISHACQHLPINRRTISRWQADDFKFKDRVASARFFLESIKDDVADTSHIKLMQDGYWPAIKHHLEHREIEKLKMCHYRDIATMDANTIDARERYFKNNP